MADAFYTLATWRVASGERPRGGVHAPGATSSRRRSGRRVRGATGTLIQSLDDPRQFYSFGPWRTEEEMHAARANPRVREAIRKVVAACEEALPGAFRVVLAIGGLADVAAGSSDPWPSAAPS